MCERKGIYLSFVSCKAISIICQLLNTTHTLTFIRLTRNCYKLVVTIRWQPLKSNLRFHISELYTGYLWTLRNVEGTGVYQVHTNGE